MSKEEIPGRRDFFREAMGRMIDPLARRLERMQPVDLNRHLLRPPGAIDESLFTHQCEASGCCVSACPANAIFLVKSSTQASRGTPVIDADRAACVVCDGLHCTHACPSGALLPLREPGDIQMGLAEVYDSACVRSNHDDCDLCVERCPIGKSALRFDSDGPPQVYQAGCVGCGVCQLVCPTSPKAITIRPKSAVT